MKVAIIGAGSWGTALSIKSCAAGNETYLYHRSAKGAAYMQKYRKNPDYLKDVILPEELHISHDLKEVMTGSHIVLLVTPSQYLRDALKSIKPYVTKDMYLVNCSKGLEKHSGKRMSQVMNEELSQITEHIAILSGPNHAEEIAVNKPAMTVIGCPNKTDAKIIQEALTSDYFRIYTNADMTGVELCGTTKNIIALAAGIVYGMNLGDNAIAALLTRGLHEMTKFGLVYGAQKETYAGLAGMGDLIATCMSANSRNRRAGIELSKGKTMKEIVEGTNMVVEGFNAVLTVYEEAKHHCIDMPITEALHEVLEGKISSYDALLALMRRTLKDEVEGSLY